MDTTELASVLKLLERAGYSFPSTCPNDFICIIDPTCIWIPLLDFINTAWVILTLATIILLAGWGITMLRGAVYSMKELSQNLRTLVLIFGALSLALPIIKVIGGEQLVINQCNIIQVPQQDVHKMVQESRKSFEKSNYESFEISDSAYDEFNF
ncbi:MAG: hypothetical protein J5608_01530 [Alphaproteobacteria bacterium]|nr:hypothetical protein [Alphaproteobacteria bacterium]